MAELKTKQTDASVKDFLNKVPDKQKRDDCFAIAKMMEEATGAKPKMWGKSIVGFGSYRYKYASGREGEMLLTGFSPRKQDLVLYLGPGLENEALMARLGKHKTGKGCLYVKRLDDVDRQVLRELVGHSVETMRKRHPSR
jgi:hypothetical protein